MSQRPYVRRATVYHVMLARHGQITAASRLVPAASGPGLELDPVVVGSRGVVIPLDPGKLIELDDEGWTYGCPEILDRRNGEDRRHVSRLRAGRRQ
jgi:hypothetical protein